MATLIQSYEQQYSVLTADITSKIGRLKSGNEENHDQLIREIQANFEEANDLLEQLELESRGAGSGARVPAYRAELQRVRDEYCSVRNARNNAFEMETEDAYEEWGESEQQRRLLDNSERLERVGKTLTDGYRVMLESEQVGATVLEDLSVQRETIQRSRARLRDADANLSRSSRLLSTMIMRALQDRFVMTAVLLILAILLCLGVYFYVT